MSRPVSRAASERLSPLALAPHEADARLDGLLSVWRRANAGADVQRAATTAQLRTRVAQLVTETGDAAPLNLLMPHDLFDPRCGGIRLRQWELPSSPRLRLTRRLFRLTPDDKADAWLHRLGTDSAVLLRGGLYYYPYAIRLGEPPERYIPLCMEFLDEARGAVVELAGARPGLTEFKLLLGIHDMLRGILLHLVTASFLIEADKGDELYPATRRMLAVACAHTNHHVGLLLGSMTGATETHKLTEHFIDRTYQALTLASHGLSLTGALAERASSATLLRERHSDDLLENSAAVDLGLARLRGEVDLAQPVRCIGLVAGGAELALLAVASLRRAKVAAELQLLRLSLYQEAALRASSPISERSEDPNPASVRPATLTTSQDGAEVVTPPGDAECAIVFDDNLLTGRTLELAVHIASASANVRGAVVTRYPGPTMLPHLRIHGLPNPDHLLRDVRGMLTAMPAGMVDGQVVNKSENRILHYLDRERKGHAQ